MSEPLVTVITPAYNRASYLAETIESVLTQDYPRVEYIVLDDGSADNTREVLQKYDGRIVWETHPNMGETRTVNKALTMARGEIVVVVNSDDPLLPGAIRGAVEFMQARPDILVAYPDWNYIGPASEVTGHVQVREYDYVYMVRRHFCTPGPGAFIRRRAFELTGPRDGQFRYVADFEYWLRLGLYGQFARIPKTLATFRVHPGSASVASKGMAMADEHIRLVKRLYERVGLPPEVRRVRRQAYSWAHLVAAMTCGRARKDGFIHYLKVMWWYPPTLVEIAMFFASRAAVALLSILPAGARDAVRGAWYTVRGRTGGGETAVDGSKGVRG
jgi:glycosyltransferase involved in cell wall biosynthesis